MPALRYLLDQRREPHNFRIGPVYFRFGAGLRLEYSDNVDNSSRGEREGDLITTAQIYMSGHWAVSKINDVTLLLGFGYTSYLAHPDLNTTSQTLQLTPGTEIAFKAKVGQVYLNFYERPTVGQEQSDELTLRSGLIYSTFQNIAGVTAFLDLNDVRLQGGYQRTDTFPLSSGSTSDDNDQNEAAEDAALDSLSRSVDSLHGTVTFRLQDDTSAGLEATASKITYREGLQNDGFSYSGGAFIGKQLTNYISLRIAVGYQQTSFESSGLNGDSSNSSHPYYNLELRHRVNRFLSHALAIGNESDLGTTTNTVQTTYITDNITYNFAKDLALGVLISYQRGEESGSRAAEPLTLFRVGMSFGYNLTRKLAMTAFYEFVTRIGGGATGDYNSPSGLARQESDDYYQNRIGVSFSYAF